MKMLLKINIIRGQVLNYSSGLCLQESILETLQPVQISNRHYQH